MYRPAYAQSSMDTCGCIWQNWSVVINVCLFTLGSVKLHSKGIVPIYKSASNVWKFLCPTSWYFNFLNFFKFNGCEIESNYCFNLHFPNYWWVSAISTWWLTLWHPLLWFALICCKPSKALEGYLILSKIYTLWKES